MDSCQAGFNNYDDYEKNFTEETITKCNGCTEVTYEDGLMCCTKFSNNTDTKE